MTQKKIRIYKYLLNYINKIFIFFVILIFLFIFHINILKKRRQTKVCICTIGKLENKYVLEFVEHYKKLHIDKIFIYDNNDINGENFEDILSSYIKLNFIEIINHRGEKKIQIKMFQDCYKKNYKLYDWLLFYDIDEYIHLKKYNNIKDFLIQKRFNKCQSIHLNWIMHTDNNLIYYDNRFLYKRFPEVAKIKNYCYGKTIVRGNIENLKFTSTHILDKKLGRCDGLGKIIQIKKRSCKVPDYKLFYIDHYFCKSTEEYINKINKGDAIVDQNIANKYVRIKLYFKFNKITKEKIYFIEKKTHLNFSLIMKKLKKIKK